MTMMVKPVKDSVGQRRGILRMIPGESNDGYRSGIFAKLDTLISREVSSLLYAHRG